MVAGACYRVDRLFFAHEGSGRGFAANSRDASSNYFESLD
jgi:hypothetical protein